MAPPALLLVGADEASAQATQALLQAAGIITTIARDAEEARAHLAREVFDVIVVADGSPAHVVELAPLTPVGLLAGSSMKTSVEPSGLAFVLDETATRGDLVDAVARCVQVPPLTSAIATTIRRYFSCLERAAWSELRDICSDDVHYDPPGDATSRRAIEGLDAFETFAAETFAQFVEPRFAITSMRSLPTGTLVRYDATWIDSGRVRIGMSGAIMFGLEQNRIVRISVRLDLATLDELGVGPALD